MDKKLIDQKFNENINLIHFVINKFVQNKENLNILCSYDDLFQVGSIGLFHAITSYNEKYGAFSTYATNVIRNRIYNELRDTADRSSDFSLSLDDEDTSYIENNVSLIYNDHQGSIEDHLFEISQKEILYKIADKYTGISKKGVLAIQLMTEGYTCKAIAKIFKTDDKTLTSWVSRARSKLKTEPEILNLLGRENNNV